MKRRPPDGVAQLIKELLQELREDLGSEPPPRGSADLPWSDDHFALWLAMREANGIVGDPNWPDVEHSSLLQRIATGAPVFEHAPPLSYSYPWVWLCEDGWDIADRDGDELIEGRDQEGRETLTINQSAWKIEGRHQKNGRPAWQLRWGPWRAKVEWEEGPFDIGDRWRPPPPAAFVIRLTHPAGPAPLLNLRHLTEIGEAPMSGGVAAVVLPVQQEYLSELDAHHDELTTLIFGWQGKKKRSPKKLIGPERRLQKVHYLPFLFRSSRTGDSKDEARGRVSFVALCGFMVHRDQPEYRVHEAFLYDTRVERFTGRKRADEVGTFYVVAGAQRLDEPIPFEALELLSEKRPLNPRMARGYALVGLPDKLRPWYDRAVENWDRLAKAAGLTA